MATLYNGYKDVEVDNDTISNYTPISEVIEEMYGDDGLKVLDLFTNIYGMQILDEQHCVWILEELGFEEVDR